MNESLELLNLESKLGSVQNLINEIFLEIGANKYDYEFSLLNEEFKALYHNIQEITYGLGSMSSKVRKEMKANNLKL